MNRLTHALARWCTRIVPVTKVPQDLIEKVDVVVDAATGTRYDIEEFLGDLEEYIERIELAPKVLINILDAAPDRAWDVIFGAGLGPRVLIHTICACELILLNRYPEQMGDGNEQDMIEEVLEQVRLAASTQDVGLSLEGVGVATAVFRDQVDSQYQLDPADIPGLCDMEPQVLLDATQVVLIAFNLLVRRLSTIAS